MERNVKKFPEEYLRSFLPCSCFAVWLDWGRTVKTGPVWLAGAAPACALTVGAGGEELCPSLATRHMLSLPFPSGQWFTSVPCYSPGRGWGLGGADNLLSESAPKHLTRLPAADAPWRWWKVHRFSPPDQGCVNNCTGEMFWYLKKFFFKFLS